MAQSRSTTPARGATPACGMNPIADRQRGTTLSATVGRRPAIGSAVHGTGVSQANESRPGLVGGMSASLPQPNYPKVPKKSPSKILKSTRVTRQQDGTLPPALERLLEEAAKRVKKTTSKAAPKTATTKGTKSGVGVKKATKTPAKKAASRSSATRSSPPAGRTLTAKATKKSWAKKAVATKKAGATKKRSSKGKS